MHQIFRVFTVRLVSAEQIQLAIDCERRADIRADVPRESKLNVYVSCNYPLLTL
jgi:hypothetical protein